MALSVSTKSSFDTLPNELLREIIRYAMVRDTPFDLDSCLRTATAVEASAKSKSNKTTRNKTGGENPFLRWRLHALDSETQRQHLQDWHIASSVCRCIRSMGKEAFFSNKVFAMDLALAKKLQARTLSRLTTEDQQTASRHINSIILIVDNPPLCTFIGLPRCIAGFRNLKSIDFFFGAQEWEWAFWSIKATKCRMQPPAHFNDALTVIGIPIDKITIGILSSDTWSFHEHLLKIHVYPMVKFWAAWKLMKEYKEVDG